MKIYKEYDLSCLNTFRMKARAATFVDIKDEKDLETFDFSSVPRPLFFLGGGSNILFTKDFQGTVLRFSADRRELLSDECDDTSVCIRVGAGAVFDELCSWACEEGFWGLENLSMIPGNVSGAAVQNNGAYGAEAGDVIESVRCFDIKEGCFVSFDKEACRFAYRDSFFKSPHAKGRYLITAVTFRLSKVPKPRLGYGNLKSLLAGISDLTPLDVRRAVSSVRRSKLPDPEQIGSAGSFFRNPVLTGEEFRLLLAKAEALGIDAEAVPCYPQGDLVKTSAAWLIDRSGLKGYGIGGAQVYQSQPLVIVNASGEASSKDVLELENHIINTVLEVFGVHLVPEVEHVPAIY